MDAEAAVLGGRRAVRGDAVRTGGGVPEREALAASHAEGPEGSGRTRKARWRGRRRGVRPRVTACRRRPGHLPRAGPGGGPGSSPRAAEGPPPRTRSSARAGRPPPPCTGRRWPGARGRAHASHDPALRPPGRRAGLPGAALRGVPPRQVSVEIHSRGRAPSSQSGDPGQEGAPLGRAGLGERCARALRSWDRPRWMRERTVPSFTPRVAAISSYDSPSMSHRTTAARNSGARVSRACWTSASKWASLNSCCGGGLAAGQALGRVLAEGVEADALLAPDHVQEEVGGDAVQPALEGARRVRRQGAEDADEDLLGEVLGVVLVSRQAVGESVDPAAVRTDDLLPRGRSPRLPVRVGGEGRGLGLACGETGGVAVSSGVGHGFRPARRPEEAPQHSTPIPGRSRTLPLSALVVSSGALP